MTALAELMPAVSNPSWPLAGTALLEMSSLHPVSSHLFAPVAEARLHPRLRDIASRLPGAYRGVVVCAEFRSPVGVPDLVALVVDADVMSARLALDVAPLLSEQDCRVVAFADGRRDVAGVVEAAGFSADNGVRRVRRLVRVGALLVDGAGRLRPVVGLQPMGRLWALEAKVSDWRGGLAQAHKYRVWADGAVLVLERAGLSPDVLAAEAAYYRVGVHCGGRWVRRPERVEPDPTYRLWASEHMVAALRGR